MLKGAMSARSTLTTLLAIFFVVAALADCGKLATAQKQNISSTVLEQIDLGDLPAGERVLKMTLVEMQPGAAIPAHTHKGRGGRYVLEGAVSIAWKDRGVQTLKAGTTYFEGAGENHPPGEMSAKNVAEGMTRILVIEVEIRQRVAAAWLASTEGKPAEAVQLMRSAADLEAASTKHPMLTPPIALAHESLGELLLEHGEPEYALQAFEASLREYPSRLAALYGAALASELSGDLAKAQAFSRRFVRAAERVTSDSGRLARAKTLLATGHVEP